MGSAGGVVMCGSDGGSCGQGVRAGAVMVWMCVASLLLWALAGGIVLATVDAMLGQEGPHGKGEAEEEHPGSGVAVEDGVTSPESWGGAGGRARPGGGGNLGEEGEDG